MSARAVVVAAVAIALLAPAAAAHADLVTSEPAAGSAVERAPERVTLLFSEPLDAAFSGVRVRNSEGVEVDKGDATFAGKEVAVSLPALPHGIYVVEWRALSKADGHTTRGTVPFAVGDPALAAGLGTGATSELSTGGAPEALARGVGFVGLALAVGAASFRLLVATRLPDDAQTAVRAHARRAGLAGGVVAAAGALALAVLAAERAGGGDLGAFLTDTRGGRILLARAATALLLAAVSATPAASPRAVAAAALAAILPVSAGSHAAAHGALPVAADVLHLAAVAAWVGGLALVATLALRGAAPNRALIAAFTPAATAFVVVALVTGTFVALTLADWRTLPSTEWGREVLLKVGLVLPMLLLGALNGYVLAPARDRGRDIDRPFRASVSAEFLLGVAVLVVAGFLTNASPTEAETGGPVGPPALRLQGSADDLAIELVVAPAPLVPGSHRFDVLVREPAGGDHNITNVTLEISRPADAARGEVAVPLEVVDHGEQYGVDGTYLVAPGEWRVEVKFRRTDAYDARAVFMLEVGATGSGP